MTNAAKRERRILLALSGLSPQVVTETPFGLTQCTEPWIPTEVHLFTTREGRERARLQLLSASPGWFYKLRADYDLPEIRFDESHIHLPYWEDGRSIEDLRSPEENQRAADSLLELVREFTNDDDSALHVSIAGGRKTMGFYAGYALSLYGRPHDRLSHVLVSDEFESDPQFFYPTRESAVIYSSRYNNKPLDSKDAKVTLADIPFVRMRDGLPRRLLQGKTSFSQTVAAAQRANEPPRLAIDVGSGSVRAGDEMLSLTGAELAFYLWMARRRATDSEPVRWDDEGVAEEFLTAYRDVAGDMDAQFARAEDALANGMDSDYFDHRKSRVNTAIKNQLGHALARHYQIAAVGRRPATRFGLLGLDPDAIRIE